MTDFCDPKIRDILCHGPWWYFEGEKDKYEALISAAEHCLKMGYVVKDSWPWSDKIVIRYTVTELGAKAIDTHDKELNEKFDEIFRKLNNDD
jgi:hypothetical protein